MELIARIIVYVNVITNFIGEHVLGFIGVLPGWLSNTIIAAVTGLVLLFVFKHTSNQKAIQKTRDHIKANMLALKLFKDSIFVTLKAQAGLFGGAFKLFFHALRPMVVMIIPFSLLFAQLGLWYQYRPLEVEDKTVITVELKEKAAELMNNLDSFSVISGGRVTEGPVRVFDKNQVCWNLRFDEPGRHSVSFRIGEHTAGKEIAVGGGFKRIAPKRPGCNWSEVLMYPSEKPLPTEHPVKSITVEYPERESWTSGSDWWVIYFFIASMIFAFLFRPFVKVKI